MKSVKWNLSIEDANAIHQDCKSAINELESMLGPENLKNAPTIITDPYVHDLKKYKRWKKSLEVALSVYHS
jgi:hypothetical protein